jgi:uncharacterized protein
MIRNSEWLPKGHQRMGQAASPRPLAVVTGASSGIGYELARCCAQNGFDLILAADESEIEDAANDFSIYGGDVIPVEADLATIEGVEKLYAANDSSHVAV